MDFLLTGTNGEKEHSKQRSDCVILPTKGQMLMKSMVLTGIRQMEMIEIPEPALERGNEVLLRLESVGVCGSDVHYYETGRIGSQVVQYPFRVGHECAAVVEAVGPAVTRVRPGDRVAVDPAMSCWQCDQCRAGRPHTCRKLRFLGCPGQSEGCLAEKIVMPEESCFLLAPNMTFERGALSEPLTIGYYAVKQSIPMNGARVGILGAGPIGLSVLLCARAKGASAVYMTDKIPERVEMARRAGATWAENPEKTDIVEEIKTRDPLLLDAVFECAGQQETVNQAFELLKPGGKLMLIGIPREDRLSFSIDLGRRKEICIQNVRRQNECVQATLDAMADGRLDADFMVTHRFPFERTREAFDLVADYRDGVVKAMIHFGDAQ